jgi:UDP-glucose 4-epimerase
MTKAVVTGGAGFIGSHLVDLLLKEDIEVTCIDNLATGRIENLSGALQNPRFRMTEADINESGRIASVMRDTDWVFHLAGLADIVPSIERPEDYFRANVDGTFNVMEAARHADVRKVLYAASSSCYGLPDVFPTPETAECRPMYPYALTKYLGEQIVLHWAQVYRIAAVSLRLFNVFGVRSTTRGAYGSVFGVFLRQKLAAKPFTIVGDGSQSRDFTYVTDVARAFLAAARSTASGIAVNIGSGGTHTVNRLTELLGGQVTFVPKRPGEPDCTFADISRARNVLEWSPTISFEAGVAAVLSNIDRWRDAPLWDAESIASATAVWFANLSQREQGHAAL